MSLTEMESVALRQLPELLSLQLQELREIKTLLTGTSEKVQDRQVDIVQQLVVLSSGFPPEVREAVMKLTANLDKGRG